MSKGKAPKTPDPTVVANAQADANIKTAQATAGLNRYDQSTPFGSVSWSQDPNNPNKYTSTTNYDPVTQAIIDKTRAGVSGLTDRATNILGQANPIAPGQQYAEDAMTRVGSYLPSTKDFAQNTLNVVPEANAAMSQGIGNFRNTISQPYNFDSAPAMPTADEATRNSVADSLYNQSKSRLDPTFGQASSNLESRLAAQGITQGTDAYNREIDNLSRDKNDAYTSASNAANLSGINAMSDLFGMGMQARQQGVGETQAIRDQASKEALTSAQLAGGATNNAATAVGTNIANVSAVPQIAGALMNNATQGFTNENNQRNQAVNELGNVRNIMNSTVPNLQPGIAGDTQVGQTPVADSVYNSYQGDMQKYAGDVGSSNNLISGLAGLGGMAMLAPAGTMAGIGAGGSAALTGLMAF